MFDLKDTAVFIYKTALHKEIYIYLGGFWEVNVMKLVKENFVQ